MGADAVPYYLQRWALSHWASEGEGASKRQETPTLRSVLKVVPLSLCLHFDPHRGQVPSGASPFLLETHPQPYVAYGRSSAAYDDPLLAIPEPFSYVA